MKISPQMARSMNRGGSRPRTTGGWIQYLPMAIDVGSRIFGAMKSSKRNRQDIGGARAPFEDLQGISRSEWNRYDQFATPLLEQLSGQVNDEAGTQRRVAQAGMDVDQGFGQARDRMRTELSRYGVDPSSGRYAGSMRQMALGQAGSRAAAMTGERARSEDMGFNRGLGLLRSLSAGRNAAINAGAVAGSGLARLSGQAMNNRGSRDAALFGALNDGAQAVSDIYADKKT